MKRWRVVGLIGVPTDDGRILVGEVTIRPGPIVLLRRPRGYEAGRGHEGAIPAPEPVEVRLVGREIQARLAWRDRRSTPAFGPRFVGWRDEALDPENSLCELHDPVLLVMGPGPSAWEQLR